MENKLYFQLDDGEIAYIMELSGCFEYIKNEMSAFNEVDNESRKYTLTPMYITEEEFENLPEA